jgi:hypothetical protein
LEDKILHILEALKQSPFRAKFHLGKRERIYREEKGPDIIRSHARELLSTRIAPAHPPNDGRQTPWRGHPVFIAQHATGTCCRRCIEKWHHVPRERALTPEELNYFIELIMAWIETERERGA